MKPPSRKHYEKVKPTYKELEARLKATEENAKHAFEDRDVYRKAYNMFHFLMRQEIFIADDEGMKILTGEDLAIYCNERLIKEDRERHAGYETINLNFAGFTGFAHNYISQIIRDEVDKLATHQLDAYKYITKGRYDTRGKSKKESR